jgi:AcrR family transcriptional regulator
MRRKVPVAGAVGTRPPKDEATPPGARRGRPVDRSKKQPGDGPPGKRGRGRPRAYEPGPALDAALGVFWTKGYGATSLDDLTTAMAMSRPSVYAAFGNKQAIYQAAVDHYVATIGSRFLKPLAEEATLRAGLLGFYLAVIDSVTGKYGPLGCIVACTMPAEAGHSPQARKHQATVLAQLDAALLARMHAAHTAGEIPAGADAATLAQVATSGMLALSIRARSGAPRRGLLELARTFVDLIAPPA